MANEAIDGGARVANPVSHMDDRTWWAGVWLAAWQRSGNFVTLFGNNLGFVYGQGEDRDPEMTRLLQILINMTPGGVDMLFDYVRRYGCGNVEMYPFRPQPVDGEAA